MHHQELDAEPHPPPKKKGKFIITRFGGAGVCPSYYFRDANFSSLTLDSQNSWFFIESSHILVLSKSYWAFFPLS